MPAEPTRRPAAGEPAAAPRRAARQRWLLLGMPLVAAAVLAAVLASGGGPAATVSLRPFSLPREGPAGVVAGQPVRYPLTGADARHPVVLVFFASWCVGCRADVPVAADVARAEARAGNRAVFIGIDGNDAATTGWAFAHRRGVTFPVAADEDEQVAGQIGLTGLPSTAVVSPAGRVVWHFTGPVSAATLEAAVAQVAPAHAARS